MAAPFHHKDLATVHGHVQAEDCKGSTWISKDAHVAPVSLLGWQKRLQKENFDPDFEEFFLNEQPKSSAALKRKYGS